MNIDEYRALVAQDQAGSEQNVQAQQEPVAISQEVVQEPTEVQPVEQPTTKQEEVEQIQEPVSKVKFGDEEYEIEELIQRAKKAEELEQVAQQLNQRVQSTQTAEQYYQAMMSNPEYAKAFAEKNNLPFIDPKEQAVQELEKRYNDLLLEREIDNMKLKYQDFEPRDVIKFALDNGISRLEDAYLLSKAKKQPQTMNQAPDIDSLKEQIRQEILNELKSNVDTGSLIGASGSGAKPVQDTTPQLSQAELRVARGLGLTPEEYVKYKNVK